MARPDQQTVAPAAQSHPDDVLDAGEPTSPARVAVGSRDAYNQAPMSLSSGTRLGAYEVVAALGAGGMGEVYRARDTKLDRDVALKVLPDLFANDPERLGRFQREAKVLASLNHPNIGSIYGLEESDGVQALVLELIEGPTLADRIAQGPIPIDEALPIARQIAEALEAAHEQGIIHRDLKPANIKVTPEGRVKVLDFGLAKSVLRGAEIDPSQIETLTMATEAGQILGTPGFMSPEQARGEPTDSLTDVWGFGCVVYELLSGKQPFAGKTVPDTFAAIGAGTRLGRLATIDSGSDSRASAAVSRERFGAQASERH